MPYRVAIQGTGQYHGPDGSGLERDLPGLLSGWLEQDGFTFYFVDSVDSAFTVQFKGEAGKRILASRYIQRLLAWDDVVPR